MGASDRPPPGTTIPAFFEEWLPAAYAASGKTAPAGAPRVLARISGEGGGAWEILIDDGGLHVEAAARGGTDPDVLLRQSTADLRAALDGDPDLPELLPRGWSALDLLFLDPRDVDLMRQISGRLLVEIAGRRGRRWSFDVGFGRAGVTAGRPRATIRLDGATFEGLAAGRLPPMQPLLDGRLKLEGDRALGMQAMMLVGSRLAR